MGQDYKVHTFTSDGTLSVSVAGEVDALIIGGGGSGGSGGSGGGGSSAGSIYAGGLRATTPVQGFNGANSNSSSPYPAGGGGGAARAGDAYSGSGAT